MPTIVTDDGVALHAESTGTGAPLLFIHEFAGDHRSWEPQVRFFGQAYRCVTYAARGYPPSSVPQDPAAYSQERAVADAVAVLDGLGIDRAHVAGLSMGGFTALHLALRHPGRVASAVVAGAGYGAAPERAAAFRAECLATAAAFEAEGAEQVAQRYAVGPARVQFQNKNPRGWAEFAAALAGHCAQGSALTMRGVQAARPSLYALRDDLAKVTAPVLLIAGDEDEGCLEPALMLKRTIPSAGLVILPRTGHTANLEEPAVFNEVVDRFLAAVGRGAWLPRDPRSVSESTTGMLRTGQGGRVDEDAARHDGVSQADREDLVAFARRMDGDGLAPGTSGNLSLRRGDVVAITPSGVPYERMGPADICLVALADGTPLPGLRPSTETPMHLAVYKATGADAIVHTHSPFVVALSTVLDELPAVHYAMAGLGGIVRVAPYTRFGTPQLASNAVAALEGRSAVILRNHGALTCGPDLARAYERATTLEWLARVYWHARLAGTPQTLSEAQLTEVSEATRALRYGEQSPLPHSGDAR